MTTLQPNEEEAMAYARSRVQFFDKQKGKRAIVGVVGASVIVMALLLGKLISDVSRKIGVDLWQDERFLAGVAIGFLALITVGFGALAFLRMFSILYAKELAAYRLLLKLKDRETTASPTI